MSTRRTSLGCENQVMFILIPICVLVLWVVVVSIHPSCYSEAVQKKENKKKLLRPLLRVLSWYIP